MAQVTFTIPDTKIQFFIDCFGEDYQSKVDDGIIDGQAVTQTAYAKEQAFKYLAERVRVWKKSMDTQQIQEVDITQ